MFKDTPAFSGFSVNDIKTAKKFYSQTLGLAVEELPGMGFKLKLATGGQVFVYPKGEAHTPATFTVLNFQVTDIDTAVADLNAKGITFERYDGMHQDENGVARPQSPEDGPCIAWFKDPAGNILAVLENNL
jgi:predicted enzyme related to lactoylglutathione lyase